MIAPSRMVVLAAAATAAATTLSAKPPARHHTCHRAAGAHSISSLARMDLTPHDFLVRPYAPPADGQYADSLKAAVDLRVARDGPVVSLGYNHDPLRPSDPTAATLSTATTAQSRSSLGALVSYPFR